MDSDTLKKRTAKAVRFLFLLPYPSLMSLSETSHIRTSPHPMKHLIAYLRREQTGTLFYSVLFPAICKIFVSLSSRSPLFFPLRENKTSFQIFPSPNHYHTGNTAHSEKRTNGILFFLQFHQFSKSLIFSHIHNKFIYQGRAQNYENNEE